MEHSDKATQTYIKLLILAINNIFKRILSEN